MAVPLLFSRCKYHGLEMELITGFIDFEQFRLQVLLAGYRRRSYLSTVLTQVCRMWR
jgi:hypothetical protein